MTHVTNKGSLGCIKLALQTELKSLLKRFLIIYQMRKFKNYKMTHYFEHKTSTPLSNFSTEIYLTQLT